MLTAVIDPPTIYGGARQRRDGLLDETGRSCDLPRAIVRALQKHAFDSQQRNSKHVIRDIFERTTLGRNFLESAR